MGSSSSTAGKCLDCANVCVVPNAITPESGNSSASEMANHERADEKSKGSLRDSTTRTEQHFTSNIGLSELSAKKIGSVGNEVKKENAEILKRRTAMKTNVVPQHGNGQTMLNLINRHFSYLPSDKYEISYTTRRQDGDYDKKAVLDDVPMSRRKPR